MSKYLALARHLAARRDSRVPMTFAEIERILGTPLPPSARRHPAWWANSGGSHIQSRGWMEAGFQSEQVDLAAERLTFVRLNSVEPARPKGDHPLYGCLAGTVTIPEGVDITEPVYTDAEWDAFLDRKVALMRGEQP